MSRVLIFGAQGQLGHQLAVDLNQQGFEVVGLSRQEAPITDRGAISRAFLQHQPDLVFNAAAYNAVDRAQQDVDEALAANALGPGLLAAACRNHQATLVHFSTDYVFGAGHSSPIDETQAPAPLSVYGRSKLHGERLAMHNCTQTFIVRCCGLYGERRANFVRTMIRMAVAGKPLKVVADQQVNPTWVAPLSRVAIALSQTRLYGVYHAGAHGATSWHDFAARIFARLELPAQLSAIAQADWGAPAPRSPYSALDNAMLRLLGLDTLEPWDAMLDAFLEEHGQAMVEQERAALPG